MEIQSFVAISFEAMLESVWFRDWFRKQHDAAHTDVKIRAFQS